MLPILFRLGGYEVSSSLFFLILGILSMLALGWVEARRGGVPDRLFHGFWVSVVPLALLLAILNGWIFNAGVSAGLRNIARAEYAGLVSFGAVLGAMLWGFAYARLTRLSAGAFIDTIAAILPLGLGVYRIGCILTSCCYGLETDGWLGVYLPGRGGEWANRYPTQIMLMLFNFTLFAWLWRRRKRTAFEGQQALFFLIAYSTGRLLIDALRDLPRVLGPFSLHQLTSIAILLITGYTAFELWRERRARPGL